MGAFVGPNITVPDIVDINPDCITISAQVDCLSGYNITIWNTTYNYIFVKSVPANQRFYFYSNGDGTGSTRLKGENLLGIL